MPKVNTDSKSGTSSTCVSSTSWQAVVRGRARRYNTDSLQGSNVGYDDSGDHYALSGHLKNALGPLTLYSQLTYYMYDIADDVPWGSGDLIHMGAYDEATLTAS